jgi:hypothetical protein
MDYRPYDPAKDKEAIQRIWREIGWLEKGKEESLDLLLSCSRALVADISGGPECLVLTTPGTMRYLGEELSFIAVTGVTTSLIARKQGLAKRLLTQALAAEAAAGALVVSLGVFEQGYYDQLGFGTGSYEIWCTFDPARLKIATKPRVPRRLTINDWPAMHAARLARRRGHGSANINPPELTHADLIWSENGFGLGYSDGPNGELTHYLWVSAKELEHGPYDAWLMVFQTVEQFRELMALLQSLGDQVRAVSLREPPGIQMQDMLEQPFRQRALTKGSKFESSSRASAYWQVRLLNLPGCLARTHLPGHEVRFNLRLTDPVEPFLDEKAPWHGVAGDYVVTLGHSSGAEPGRDAALPTLSASVGAFTRLWLGVRPATSLAITDDLAGPPALLENLDWALRLPAPKPDWDF